MSYSTPKTRAISRVPQEIWDTVAHKITSLTVGHAARILGFKIPPEQQPHIDLWSAIFKDEEWLDIAIAMGKGGEEWEKSNPALIGCDLRKLVSGERSGRGCYLVLVAQNRVDDLRFEKEKLLRSMKPHAFHQEKQEVEFPNGLTVNIFNVYSDGDEFIPVRLDKLFHYRNGGLQTSYVNYLDEKDMMRDVGPEGIVGIGGQATKISKVKKVCGVNLVLPDGGRMQFLFRKRGLRSANIAPIGNTKVNEHGGWKLVPRYYTHYSEREQAGILRRFREHILMW